VAFLILKIRSHEQIDVVRKL